MTKQPGSWLYTAWPGAGYYIMPISSYEVVQPRAWHNARNKTGSYPTPARCQGLSEHPWAALQVPLGSSLVLHGPARVLMEVPLKQSVGDMPDHQCLQLFQTPTRGVLPLLLLEGQPTSNVLYCLVGRSHPHFGPEHLQTWMLRDDAHLCHISHTARDKSVSQGLRAPSLKRERWNFPAAYYSLSAHSTSPLWWWQPPATVSARHSGILISAGISRGQFSIHSKCWTAARDRWKGERRWLYGFSPRLAAQPAGTAARGRPATGKLFSPVWASKADGQSTGDGSCAVP